MCACLAARGHNCDEAQCSVAGGFNFVGLINSEQQLVSISRRRFCIGLMLEALVGRLDDVDVVLVDDRCRR